MSHIQPISTMTWGQRLALIEVYKPTEAEVCEIFHVTPQVYRSALAMYKQGAVRIDRTINVEHYASVFGRSPILTNIVPPTPPVHKPRPGRPGDKVLTAFQHVPYEPVDVEYFMKEHGISLPVLRQWKRFDKTGIADPVQVRQIQGVLKIWRQRVQT